MFDLKNAGSRKFVSQKAVKKPWNDGLNVLEVNETHLTMSNVMCEQLGLEDDSVITIFHEDGWYLANVTSEVKEVKNNYVYFNDGSRLPKQDFGIVSKEKPSQKVDGVNYYKSRRCQTSPLIKTFVERMGADLGEYQSGGIVEASFPVIKLIAVSNEVDNMEENVDIAEVNEIIVENTVNAQPENVQMAAEFKGTNAVW